MTSNDRAERRLEYGLDLLAEPRFPDYLDDVLAVTSRRSQRPAWTFPGRWLPFVDAAHRSMSPAVPWRAIAVVVALLLVAALAVVIVGSWRKLPPPIGPASNGLFAWDSGDGIAITDPVT